MTREEYITMDIYGEYKKDFELLNHKVGELHDYHDNIYLTEGDLFDLVKEIHERMNNITMELIHLLHYEEEGAEKILGLYESYHEFVYNTYNVEYTDEKFETEIKHYYIALLSYQVDALYIAKIE